MDMDAQ